MYTGGCSRFGHSCFGAHGKRADIAAGYNGNVDPMMMVAPGGSNQVGAGGAVPSDAIPDGYYPNLLPMSSASNNRMSPYLLEWILSAHRGGDSSRQVPNPSADDMQTAYRRK
ncbi:hypothetical protein Ocin01_03644 [Orchesella cincta]|uniref:Uncharacterized protein n=1 Tax=Orchesella cincta TaxID=48709 RepID=A0A1D2NCP2_ORCCI|nr:hypothetical protein Ocin01_03644 [Orchesella cincta]